MTLARMTQEEASNLDASITAAFAQSLASVARQRLLVDPSSLARGLNNSNPNYIHQATPLHSRATCDYCGGRAIDKAQRCAGCGAAR